MPIVTSEAPAVRWDSADGMYEVAFQASGEDEEGLFVLPGATGLGMPSYSFYETQSPGLDGSIVRDVRADGRTINLPVHLWAASRDRLLYNFHNMTSTMNPKLGMGALSFMDVHGTFRIIRAYLADGLTGQDDDDAWGMRHMSAVLSFKAPSPYFEGEPITQSFSSTPGAGGLFFPILPLKVSSASTLGVTTIYNSGDAPAQPVFTVRGPCTSIVLTNNTTGQSITVNQALIVSDVMVIDTRDGAKSVVMGGSNYYGALDLASVMWNLAQGWSDITLSLAGATTASSVSILYRERFLSAY